MRGAGGAGGVALVAGEETRSREAGENTEVAARHLVPFGAALRAGDPVRADCGDDGEFHEPLPLALSIPYSAQNRSLVFDYRSLMEHNLPSHFRVPPEGRAPGFAYLLLNQRAGEEGEVAPSPSHKTWLNCLQR